MNALELEHFGQCSLLQKALDLSDIERSGKKS